MNIEMNAKQAVKNWSELKGKIHSKWTKFSSDEVDSVKNDLSLISAKVQKTYGIAKELADKQVAEFKASVSTLIEPMPTVEALKESPAAVKIVN